MIEIDGSQGEGGGQIFRMAVSLSALTGKSVRVFNIRKNRPRPGLSPQHLTALLAVAEQCNAEIRGGEVRSEEVVFEPGELEIGRYGYDVGTAGSVALVLQACLIPAVKSDGGASFEISGGTNVKWSPPTDYYSCVLFPLLRMMGVDISLEVPRRGFYPRGGGRICARVSRSGEIMPLELAEKGELRGVRGVCFSRNLPSHVCKRISHTARRGLLEVHSVNIRRDEGKGPSTGAGIVLSARYENTVMGADALGEKGVPSEEVGRKATQNLKKEMEGGGTLDVHAADQLVPYMAMASGPSSFRVREISEHLRTQMSLIPHFLATDFEVRERAGTAEVRVLPNRT